MAAQIPSQAKVNLIQSFNTSTVNEDVNEFGIDAQHIDFQGIERDGGLMSVGYEPYIGDSAIGAPIPTSLYDYSTASNGAMLPGIRRRLVFPDNTLDAIAYAVNANGTGDLAPAYGLLYRAPDGNLWSQNCYANGYVIDGSQAFMAPAEVTGVPLAGPDYGSYWRSGLLEGPAIMRPKGGQCTIETSIEAICAVNITNHAFFILEPDLVNTSYDGLAIDVDYRIFSETARTTQTQGFGAYVGLPGMNPQNWASLDPTANGVNYSSYALLKSPTEVDYYPGISYMTPIPNYGVGGAYCTPYSVNGTVLNAGVVANQCIGRVDPTGLYTPDSYLANIRFVATNLPQAQLSYFNYFEGCFSVNSSSNTICNVHLLAEEGPSGNLQRIGLSDGNTGVETPWTYSDITAATLDPDAEYTIASGASLTSRNRFDRESKPLWNARVFFIQDIPAGISINNVPITAPGDIDSTYLPQYQLDEYGEGQQNRLVWKGLDGRFYAVETGYPNPGDQMSDDGVLPQYQKLTDDLYKYNTLQPVSIFNTRLGRAYVGPVDWNNRFLVYSSYITSGARDTVHIASAVSSDHSSGYWVGEKTVKNCRTTDLVCMPYLSLYYTGGIGTQYRFGTTSSATPYGYEARFYKALTYLHTVDCFIPVSNYTTPLRELPIETIRNATFNYIDPMFDGTDYNAASIQNYGQVPLSAGMFYGPRVAYDSSRQSSYIRDDGYDSYIAGNEIPGYYDTFDLLGSVYGFDGEKIQQLIIDNGVVSSLRPIASAVGLELIARAPTTAWFLSSFDNSLYTFTGGKDITKSIRLNKLSAIQSAVWSTKENSLVIDTTDDLLFMRDGIISRLPKTLIGSPGDWILYDTAGGTYIRDPLAVDPSTLRFGFRILYYPTDYSTILPFTLQTAYFGFDKNTKAMVQNAVITVHTDTPLTSNINFATTIESFDQDNHYSDTEYMVVSPYSNAGTVGDGVIMWSNTGYARLRITPSRQRSLGTSVKISTNSPIKLLDITWNFIADGQATIQNSR